MKSAHVAARRFLYRAEEPSGLTLLEAHIFQRGCVAVYFGCSEFRLLEKQPSRSNSENDEDFPCHSDTSAADATLNGGSQENCSFSPWWRPGEGVGRFQDIRRGTAVPRPLRCNLDVMRSCSLYSLL